MNSGEHGRWTSMPPLTNFSADLAMETSDYGISDATAVDPTNPATRSPHTHHISMTNATVSYDPSVCPVFSPPPPVLRLWSRVRPRLPGTAAPQPLRQRAHPRCKSALPVGLK